VKAEVAFCDLVAEREGERLYIEAKGRSSDAGTDADILYGQLLRRMPVDEDQSARFVVVVPMTWRKLHSGCLDAYGRRFVSKCSR
jgi:hypothetical protein